MLSPDLRCVRHADDGTADAERSRRIRRDVFVQHRTVDDAFARGEPIPQEYDTERSPRGVDPWTINTTVKNHPPAIKLWSAGNSQHSAVIRTRFDTFFTRWETFLGIFNHDKFTANTWDDPPWLPAGRCTGMGK